MNIKQWVAIGLMSVALIAIAIHHNNNPPLVSGDSYPRVIAAIVSIGLGIAAFFLLGNKATADGKSWYSMPSKSEKLSPTARIVFICVLALLVVFRAFSFLSHTPASPTEWLTMVGPIIVLPCLMVSVALGVIKDLRAK